MVEIQRKRDKLMRISKDEYYLEIAKVIAKRSTCLRRQYGAVIVKNDMIVGTGYNGSARGQSNCCDVETCWRELNNIPHGQQYEQCVAIHAENNAMSQAGRNKCIGATLYLVGIENEKEIVALPCLMCDREIKNNGIIRIVNKNGDVLNDVEKIQIN